MFIRTGDLVKVISGKDKGKQGKVLAVSAKTNRVVVEGINIVKKHVKPTNAQPKGGIIQKEASVHYSNVLLCGGVGAVARRGSAWKRSVDGKLSEKSA